MLPPVRSQRLAWAAISDQAGELSRVEREGRHQFILSTITIWLSGPRLAANSQKMLSRACEIPADRQAVLTVTPFPKYVKVSFPANGETA